MGTKASIIINGRGYDAVTGLPIDGSVTKVQVKNEPASHTVRVSRQPAKHHAVKPHHSTTLRRDIVAKPRGAHDHAAKNIHQHSHVAKSPAISKFAPHPTVAPARSTADTHSQVVTAVHQAHATRHVQPKPAMSSRELKDHLIATKLAEATPNKKKPAKQPLTHKHLRVSSVMSACFAVMVLGGYLSYINMPHLSVRVAAAQAGIDASYPNYTPSGYSFDGPVAYSDGQVSLAFAANGGNTGYKITEKKSSWDSQTVLDNLVAVNSQSYDTTQSNGLTIYTYGSNAAWVDKGTLYTINGDAPLDTQQIVHIATSL